MEKMGRVTYDKDMFSIDLLHTTEYDNLFDFKVRQRGISYHTNHKVKDINFNNNTLTGVVEGTDSYDVSITFKNDKELDVKCECVYHRETNKYCKHIYALLISYKMEGIFKKDLTILKDNINKLIEVKDKYIKLYEENKRNLKYKEYSILRNIEDFNRNIKHLEESNLEAYRLFYATIASYNFLNSAISYYNELIDDIIHFKEKEEQKRIEKEKIKEEKKLEKETTKDNKSGYAINDDFIFDAIDKKIESIDLDKLKYIREQFIKDGEDTEIIDRAIKNKIKKEEMLKLKQQREEDLSFFDMMFLYTLYGKGMNKLFKHSKSRGSSYQEDPDGLMPWERELVDNGEHEPYQFEEEELEEDDYYYEDLD